MQYLDQGENIPPGHGVGPGPCLWCGNNPGMPVQDGKSDSRYVHICVCVSDPWHGSPPFLAFVLIYLDFFIIPHPQDLEHELHLLQGDHSQLTEIASLF